MKLINYIIYIFFNLNKQHVGLALHDYICFLFIHKLRCLHIFICNTTNTFKVMKPTHYTHIYINGKNVENLM